MIAQSRNVAVLNIFVLGSRSFGNGIEGNTITTAAAGPQGDVVMRKIIRGFPAAISVVESAAYNVFQANTLFYSKSAFDSKNASNQDLDNTKIQLRSTNRHIRSGAGAVPDRRLGSCPDRSRTP